MDKLIRDLTAKLKDPFGADSASGEANANSFRYTGRESDGTSLIYYRARYYSPLYHHYISEDPIEFRGGNPSLYVYAADSPLTFNDPFGLQVRTPGRGRPPNSKGWYKSPDGKVDVERYFGPDGKATDEYNYGEDYEGKGDPHRHPWDWSKYPPRRPAVRVPWWDKCLKARAPFVPTRWPGPFIMMVDPCLLDPILCERIERPPAS